MAESDLESPNDFAHLAYTASDGTMRVQFTRAVIALKKREAQRHHRTFIAVLLIAAFYLTVPVAVWTKPIVAVVAVLALWCIYRLTMHVRYWKQTPPAD